MEQRFATSAEAKRFASRPEVEVEEYLYGTHTIEVSFEVREPKYKRQMRRRQEEFQAIVDRDNGLAK